MYFFASLYLCLLFSLHHVRKVCNNNFSPLSTEDSTILQQFHIYKKYTFYDFYGRIIFWYPYQQVTILWMKM